MPTEVLKNNIQTTLLAAIDSNDTVITPTDPTGFPATGEQARAAIGDEILIVAGGDGPQFDVTRGAEGTTAVGHAAGEAVRLVLTSDGFSALAELGSALKVTTRRLTTAELSTLGDTPVELVPGVPGALLMGVSVVGQTAPGSVPFGSAPTFTVGGGVSSNVIVDPSLSSSSAQYTSATFVALGSTTASAVGQPITVVADANPTVSGAILTSSLDAAGSLYAPGDTGTVDGGNNDATYVVDTVANGYAITGVNQGTKTFTVEGDHTGDFLPGDILQVYGSTANDATYEVASSSFSGGNSEIVVVESIPSATVDGALGATTAGTVGVISTYTITNGGTGYAPGPATLTATTGLGVSGAITIDAITSQVDMEATFTVAYYVVPVA